VLVASCSEMEAVRPQWEVVGGVESGGILVRDGQSIKSVAIADRLSTGATIEQLDLKGDRLQYRLIEGKGPAEGWISIKISGRELAVPKPATASPDVEQQQSAPEIQPTASEPAEPVVKDVEIDVELRKRIEMDAQVAKRSDLFPQHVMKYKIHGFPLPQPKLRVLCFHNAGSTESNYTGAGTPFMSWIKDTKAVELIAFDYPGRNKLLKEPKHTCAQTLASLLVGVALEKLTDGVPYVVWAHSMGTWVAFEFLMLCRKAGLPLPKAAFLMAFPGPQLPVGARTRVLLMVRCAKRSWIGTETTSLGRARLSSIAQLGRSNGSHLCAPTSRSSMSMSSSTQMPLNLTSPYTLGTSPRSTTTNLR